MNSAKQIIIIGGGLAGLTAGALLAKSGHHVQLFEARDKTGGCCATSCVDGFTFNDGALCLILPGVLDHVFNGLGLDRAQVLPLRKISAYRTTFLPDGAIVTMGDGLLISVEGGNEQVDVAQLRAELERMNARWTPVLDLLTQDMVFHPFSVKRLVTRGWRHLPRFYGSVSSELKALFSSPAVRAALSGSLLYNGVPPEKMPVTMILGLVSLLREGFFLPEGGMGKITETVRDVFTRNGGEVYLSSKVERIVVNDGRVVGVEVAGKGLVTGETVLSTTSGMATYLSLLAQNDAPARMVRKAHRAPLSHRSIVVQLGLSNRVDAPGYFIDVLPFMDEQWKLFDPPGEGEEWLAYSVPTLTMPELAPPGGSIIEMYLPVAARIPLTTWDEATKTDVAQRAIQAISRRHHVQIATMRVFSPRDFQERMNLYQGALYGLSPAAGPLALFPHQTPLPGLYQAGQTTYPGFGVVAAAMSGVFAADAILR